MVCWARALAPGRRRWPGRLMAVSGCIRRSWLVAAGPWLVQVVEKLLGAQTDVVTTTRRHLSQTLCPTLVLGPGLHQSGPSA